MSESAAPEVSALKDVVENAEREAILEALRKCDYVISRTADALAISRKNLWAKMKRYDIKY